MENRRGRPIRIWLQRRSNRQDGGWEGYGRTGQFRENGVEEPASKPRVHDPSDPAPYRRSARRLPFGLQASRSGDGEDDDPGVAIHHRAIGVEE